MIGLGSRGFFCEACGKPVDGTALMEGKYDAPESKACFVATAVYGDADAPAVRTLRHWRDEYLCLTAGGRVLIRLYEGVGPALAGTVLLRPGSRRWLRPTLDCAALVLRFRFNFDSNPVGSDEINRDFKSYQPLAENGYRKTRRLQ